MLPVSMRKVTRQPRLTFAQALARTWAWYAQQHQAAH
jgi:hypothetical protein